MPQVFQGRQSVNPEFKTANDIITGLNNYRTAGHNSGTVGIAKSSLVVAAGLLWTGTGAGLTKVYLGPQLKDPERGWQANFQIKDARNALVYNGHVSILRFD